MLERTYSLHPEYGPTVPVTVSPSHAEQERRFAEGSLNLLLPTVAVINSYAKRSMISARLQRELELVPFGVAPVDPIVQPPLNRALATVVITIDGEFRSRSVEAFIAVMPGPIECIIGRDILDAGLFRYDGPSAAFTLRLPRE